MKSSVNPGETIQFAASVTSTLSGGTVEWDTTGGSIDGQGVFTAPDTPGTYKVTANWTSWNQDLYLSATATVFVHPKSFGITSFTATPNVVSFGQSATLTWTVVGAPTQLTLDGVSVMGQTSATVYPKRRQTYTLVASNGTTTDTQTVKVAASGIDLLAGTLGGAGSLDASQGHLAGFNHPEDVVLDPTGNLYIADNSNRTIRKVTPSGVVSTLAGQVGQRGTSDGVGADARFNDPHAMARSASGQLVVLDGGRVRTVALDGTVATLPLHTPQGLPAAFTYLSSIALDASGVMYVTSNNHTLSKISPTGEVSLIAGLAGSKGSADGFGDQARFYYPSGIAIAPDGTLFVADSYNHTIRWVTPGGEVLTLAGSPGRQGDVDGRGTEARFYFPIGIAFDPARNLLFVTDGTIIRTVNRLGDVSTLAGRGYEAGNLDGLAANARFHYPGGLAVGPFGNLYVADTYNHTIRQVTSDGFTTTYAGSYAPTGTTDGRGASARFTYPSVLTLDMLGNAYVFQDPDQIRKITPRGDVTTTMALPANGEDPIDWAYGMVTDGQGGFYVADFSNAVRKIDPSGQLTTFAGALYQKGNVDGMGANARFGDLYGIAKDAQGMLYVVDDSTRVRKITPSGDVSTLYTVPMGNHLYGPIAADPFGNVFVREGYAIRKITSSGMSYLLAGSVTEYGSTDGVGSAARFGNQSGITSDAAGNLFVSDDGQHLIRKITPEGVVTTLAGKARLPQSEAGPLPGHLSNPSSIQVTGDGDLIFLSGNGIISITAPEGH